MLIQTKELLSGCISIANRIHTGNLTHQLNNLKGLLKNQGALIERHLSEEDDLDHFASTVMGLYATDRPDLVDDPCGVMFEITAHNVKKKVEAFKNGG